MVLNSSTMKFHQTVLYTVQQIPYPLQGAIVPTKIRNFKGDIVFSNSNFTFSLSEAVIPYKSFNLEVRAVGSDFVEISSDKLTIDGAVVYKGKVQDVLGLEGLMAVLTDSELKFMSGKETVR